MINTPTKRIMIVAVDQSNGRGKRQGAGSGQIGLPNWTTYGAPLRDPIMPRGASGGAPVAGSYGSIWPMLGQLFADNRNYWCSVRNTAQSGSSIVVHWCGRVTTTPAISAISIANPTQITIATTTYKDGDKVNISGSDSTPTIDGEYELTRISDTAFTIPVDVTGAGTTGTATIDTVQADGDAGFDPGDSGTIQGFITLVRDEAAKGLNSNFDEVWCVFMLGITDSSNNVIRSEFVQAHINIIDLLLTDGIKCAVGLTGINYVENPSQQTWFETVGVPALGDIMANYSGNPNVIAGVDVNTAYSGAIPIHLPEQVHWAEWVYDEVGALWYDNLSAAIP